MLNGLDYGTVKHEFRSFLDSKFDHHLLLNHRDIWASENVGTEGEYQGLPGVTVMASDPTTENFAELIGVWAEDNFQGCGTFQIKVEVWETSVNAATWEGQWRH